MYKYTRTFLTNPTILPGRKYTQLRIVRLYTNSRIFDFVYGRILSRLKHWTEVPDKFDSPEEVRKFLHQQGFNDFVITDMRPDEELI